MIAIGWVTNIFQRGAASMGRLNLYSARRTKYQRCHLAAALQAPVGTVNRGPGSALVTNRAAAMKFAARSNSAI